eukprot:UN3967
MVLALNVSVYFCKLLPLHMNGNLPVGIGMHVFAMICDLIAAFKTRLAATVTCQQFFTACSYGRPDLACLVLSILLVQLFAFALVAWTITKVYESYACPTHLWNIQFGCVDDLSDTF